jgi:hypothetical protein
MADLVNLIHNAATKLGDKASLWFVFQSSQGSLTDLFYSQETDY